MSGARATKRWGLALGGVVALALILRLVGIRHGLPYVYNADENAHFVARAIGMFGHSYNPGYFINPPAFTYVLHVLFAIRWGGRGAVGEAFAVDPGTAFTIGRVVAALLGAAAVGFLGWAGARLLDRRAGLIAAALLAVAFLPVHYGHLALNDVPALAPLTLALVGVAGVYRAGRLRDYALAGAALGLATATKYTAGIVLLPLLAAAAMAPRDRLRGSALAGGLAILAFVIANPYALLDAAGFREGLQQQSEASGDGGGKLGLEQTSGLAYYLGTTTWGLGWLPALAALGGAIGLAVRDRRLALVLVPAPVVFLVFMGLQDRFFARWLLPVYPLLCLLAAWAAVAAVDRLAPRRGWALAVAGVLLCAQALVFSIHNDVVLARADTRQLAREWMVRNVAAGAKVVVEPVFPFQWAMDPGRPSPQTGTGNRWNKWATSRSRGVVVKLEDYERTLRPALLGSYSRGGYCWVVTGSTQYGRALADPEEVPRAIRYYDELERRARLVYRVSPLGHGAPVRDFSFDFSFNAYPLSHERAGPEIRVYRLTSDTCRTRSSKPTGPTSIAPSRSRPAAVAGRRRTRWWAPSSSATARSWARASTPPTARRTPSARRSPPAPGATRAGRRSTSRSSPAATRARRRRAPTRSSRRASRAWSWPPTTRPRRPRAAASGCCATRAWRSWSRAAISRRAPGCSTSRSASTRAPAGRTCASSRR